MFTPDFQPQPWPRPRPLPPPAVTAYAPATLANCAAGFDSLGAALAPLDGGLWGDRVTARPADGFSLRCEGPHAAAVPRAEGNLVLSAAEIHSRRLAARGSRTRGCRIHAAQGAPAGRGDRLVEQLDRRRAGRAQRDRD